MTSVRGGARADVGLRQRLASHAVTPDRSEVHGAAAMLPRRPASSIVAPQERQFRATDELGDVLGAGAGDDPVTTSMRDSHLADCGRTGGDVPDYFIIRWPVERDLHVVLAGSKVPPPSYIAVVGLGSHQSAKIDRVR